MARPLPWLLLVTALVATSASGQEAHQAPAKPRARIYRLDARWDAPLLVASVLGATLPYVYASSLITPSCPCSAASVNRLDRSTLGWDSHAAHTAADVLVVSEGLGVIALDALDVHRAGGGWADEAVDATVIGESVLVAGAITTGAKYLVQRPLPVVVTEQQPELVGSPAGYRSFWSGHATIASAFATSFGETLLLRDPTSSAGTWALVGGLGLAATIGTLKIVAGDHYISDVVTGLAVGSAIGLVVPWLHRLTPAPGTGVTIAPLPGGAMVSLAAVR